MSLSTEQVRWVAHLARLELSDNAIVASAKELSAIFDYVDQLQAVPTEDVEPLAHPLKIHNVFRPDELAPSLSVDDALANAPDRHGDFFGVPAVFD
ncbi:MAG: Asp-tRNA(Asn)/Glu-tRNA(Gln) amidotransferase subunit GatC [Gemmataceae bacterium]